MKKVFAIDQDEMKFRSDFSEIRKGGQGFGINCHNVAGVHSEHAGRGVGWHRGDEE